MKPRSCRREIWRGECPQCWTACEAYQSILGNLGLRTRCVLERRFTATGIRMSVPAYRRVIGPSAIAPSTHHVAPDVTS